MSLAKVSSGRYFEPFMGGGSILKAVCESGAFEPGKIHASDLQPDLMLMWKAMQLGWKPPTEVSEELYASLRHAPPSALRGFVGFACSFGGKWFAGYARNCKVTGDRRYAKEGANVCGKQTAVYREARVRFSCQSYTDLKLKMGDLVYL